MIRKITIALIIFFFFSFSSVLIFYWSIFRGGMVGFLSLHPSLKWGVRREVFSQIDTIYRQSAAEKRLTLLVLSPDFKFIPESAAGVTEEEDIYFAEEKTLLGMRAIYFYLSPGVFENYSSEDSNFLISLFSTLKFEELAGVTEDGIKQARPLVVESRPDPVIKIEERWGGS